MNRPTTRRESHAALTALINTCRTGGRDPGDAAEAFLGRYRVERRPRPPTVFAWSCLTAGCGRSGEGNSAGLVDLAAALHRDTCGHATQIHEMP